MQFRLPSQSLPAANFQLPVGSKGAQMADPSGKTAIRMNSVPNMLPS